jgi:hypothetical protein
MPVAAVEIPKHYVPTFGRNVMWTPQQNKSRLRPYVTTDTAVGEGVAPWDIWGETEAEEATGRYDDTPIMEVERDRPWVFPKGYHWGTLIDQLDKLKQVLDPTSPMIQAARKALDRKLDRAIIMPAFFGPRWTGKDIATATSAGPVNFDTTKYQVANTVGSAGGATPVGMNVAKLKAARKILLANEAVEGENADEPVYVAITAEQWSKTWSTRPRRPTATGSTPTRSRPARSRACSASSSSISSSCRRPAPARMIATARCGSSRASA